MSGAKKITKPAKKEVAPPATKNLNKKAPVAPAKAPEKAKGGKVAAKGGKGAKGKGKKAPPKKKIVDWKTAHSHLFGKSPRDFHVGRDIQHKRDLSRFVKWPRYVRLQRQRVILKKRLKVPPAINQFTRTLAKNPATNLFKLLASYRPETPEQKHKRLVAKAKAEVKDQPMDESKKPKFVKYGINHITTLVEQRKAKLVVIAHDVDPIELVVWLPALCRKMDVPYVIVKGKARLGYLVHKKTATALAVTDVRKEHQAQLDQLIESARALYNDNVDSRKKWGGGVLGPKALAVIRLREEARAREASKVK